MINIDRKGQSARFRLLHCVAMVIAVACFAIGCKHQGTQENKIDAVPAAVPAQPAPASVSPTLTTATAGSPPPASRPTGPIEFVDVTGQAGIHLKHNSGAYGKKLLPETMGSGVCFLDYDNDGWQDIFLVNSMDWPEHKTGKSYPALYHNNHDGTFTDVTREAGLAVETYGMGCAVGDYDNDGFEDLYLTTVGSNHLYHNLGNGKFADVTAKAGVASPGFFGERCLVRLRQRRQVGPFRSALH